ncbi:MAG TPA: Uma2 family endonuclease [Blastocatellia bacterium]|nr:Uma2 family endonuclease [Blastocatellia bacterium]HMV86118.1 Uma2 family endonuclease [Blastocatellia bacterium]HMX25726.1 Uma2 family endonuclease [Blastocatellia bacterium]HMY73724.1 Uma2 family endonuclease [Blastocatellia bacterium]HMZ20927.1 Uma2 family endonuclease [Blastocatellia bacterium]
MAVAVAEAEIVHSSQVENDIVALDPDREYELINGQWEAKEMAGARHGGVVVRLIGKLWSYVDANDLGGVYSPDTTFTISDKPRLPDIAFVSAERIPLEGEPEGIWQIAPDLAIEVVSPNDVYDKVQGKLWDYFDAGVKQVWIVTPAHRTVTVYRSPVDPVVFAEGSELVSEDLLPGFRCKLSEVFKSPVRRKL